MSTRGQQLVVAASQVIYERGAAATTLAMVAAEASVPLGNVYYYFKTKDDLVAAVVASRVEELRGFLARAGEESTPVDRLCAVLDAFALRAEAIVERGCPYGTLASELGRSEAAGDAGPHGGALFAVQLEWIEAQLRAMRVRPAKARAAELLCGLQGACLVAHALHDAALFRRRLTELARELRAWAVA